MGSCKDCCPEIRASPSLDWWGGGVLKFFGATAFLAPPPGIMGGRRCSKHPKGTCTGEQRPDVGGATFATPPPNGMPPPPPPPPRRNCWNQTVGCLRPPGLAPAMRRLPPGPMIAANFVGPRQTDSSCGIVDVWYRNRQCYSLPSLFSEATVAVVGHCLDQLHRLFTKSYNHHPPCFFSRLSN